MITLNPHCPCRAAAAVRIRRSFNAAARLPFQVLPSEGMIVPRPHWQLSSFAPYCGTRGFNSIAAPGLLDNLAVRYKTVNLPGLAGFPCQASEDSPSLSTVRIVRYGGRTLAAGPGPFKLVMAAKWPGLESLNMFHTIYEFVSGYEPPGSGSLNT
eukprot:758905-Hanusia_phi.AAC.1